MARAMPSRIAPGGIAVAEEEGSSSHACATGDCARWLECGSGTRLLSIEGRVDAVVKVHGHRVDLAGVEATIATCQYVSDLCVFAAEGRVWACVVVAEGGLGALRRFCQDAWPPATRPVLVEVDRVAYSHTGKRDRARMRQASVTPHKSHTTPMFSHMSPPPPPQPPHVVSCMISH